MIPENKNAVIRVIGMGNDYRGDDAIGIKVATAVGNISHAADILISVPDGTALMEAWDGISLCIIIDCAVSGQSPGLIHVFNGLSDPIPPRLFSTYSTHAISILDAIDLGRILGRLPQCLRIYGIEGANFECGARISDAVRRAGEDVAKQVVGEIQDHIRRLACAQAR